VSDRFFLDNTGAGNAATRFGRRAADFSGAAEELQATQCRAGEVAGLVDSLMTVVQGRLYAFSDEMSIMAALVDDTVTTFNQLDVEYTI